MSDFQGDSCLGNYPPPLKPHFHIVKLEYAGVYLFFLIFGPKYRLWVLVRTAKKYK